MEYKDYYKIIGVSKDATQADIKRNYRKLARKFHPDLSKEANADEKFKEVGEAYEVLKDPEKRLAYDQLGANWQSGQDFNPPPDWGEGYEFNGDFNQQGFHGSDDAAFSDFFSSLFGQQGGAGFSGAQAAASNDHHAKVAINIEDAFNGASHVITLQSAQVDAQGRVAPQQRTLNIKIPKGIKQGQKIRLAGQGTPASKHMPAGDLYLEIDFKTHPFYHVEGHDIYLDLPIAPWEAALDAKVKAPTPSGVLDLKIPKNSVTGQKLRLKGRGIPAKTPGDLYAILHITLPPADSEKAQKVYQQMEQDLAFNPRQKLGV